LALLLSQQTAVTVYRLPTKESKLHFTSAENKRKCVVSVFHFQQTNGSFSFQLVPFSIYSGRPKYNLFLKKYRIFAAAYFRTQA
jgi:hypothetical protein